MRRVSMVGCEAERCRTRVISNDALRVKRGRTYVWLGGIAVQTGRDGRGPEAKAVLWRTKIWDVRAADVGDGRQREHARTVGSPSFVMTGLSSRVRCIVGFMNAVSALRSLLP
jgi:hypothetical protein